QPKASMISEESPSPNEVESLTSSNFTKQTASNLSVLPENASGHENVSTTNQPPVLQSLQSSMPSPQTKGTAIIWRAEALDPDGDRILYRFLLNGEEMKNWSRSGSWSFLTHYLPAGEYTITAQAMDGLHSQSDSFDSSLNSTMVILEQNQPPILKGQESDPESPSPQGSLIGSPIESSAESSAGPLAISPEDPSKPADVAASASSTTSLNQIPMLAELKPDAISPLEIGAIINWTAKAADPDGDELSYKFLLDGQDMTGWSSSPSWNWDTSGALPGTHRITVLARDGKHAPTDSFDGSIDAEFTLMDKNLPPVLLSLVPDLSSPRVLGETIVWKAEAMDPDNDPILYKFQLGGKDMIRWSESNSWSWSTRGLAADDYQITVLVRDGRHASEYSFDSSLAESFRLKTSIDQQIDQLMSQRGFNASGDTEYISSDILLKVADT
ncbi:MAG: hypothetical protein QG605_1011, partial [Euryarchaeota archaeon]|nr:hypothetical protein [Euryarchaeota archaeon]